MFKVVDGRFAGAFVFLYFIFIFLCVFLNFYLFIYLAVPGLSWWHAGSSLSHAGSVVVACGLSFPKTCGILVP